MADAKDSAANARLLSRERADFFDVTRLEEGKFGLDRSRRRKRHKSHAIALRPAGSVLESRTYTVRRNVPCLGQGGIPSLIQRMKKQAGQKRASDGNRRSWRESLHCFLSHTCKKTLRYSSANGPASRNSNRFSSLSRSEEHTSELQSRENLVCRLLLEKKNSTSEGGD